MRTGRGVVNVVDVVLRAVSSVTCCVMKTVKHHCVHRDDLHCVIDLIQFIIQHNV